MYDEKTENYLIARDHLGIIPLYMGWDSEKNFFIASELKALEGYSKKNISKHYFSSTNSQLTRWYECKWEKYDNVKNKSSNISLLKQSLSNAVKRQLMSDVPYGVLLSGGLDSSITSAIAKLYCEKRVETNDQKSAWWPTLHSFAVGLKNSPDSI